MKSSNISLSIYLAAENRFDNGTATKIDEVLLSLWDEVKEQKCAILKLSQKISMLETRESTTTDCSNPVYTSLVKRLSCSKAANDTTKKNTIASIR